MASGPPRTGVFGSKQEASLVGSAWFEPGAGSHLLPASKCAERDAGRAFVALARLCARFAGTDGQFRSDSTVEVKPPPVLFMMAMVRFCPALNDCPAVINSAKVCPGSVKMAW